MLTEDLKDKVNNLIQINIDASEGYKEAALAVSDVELQTVFNTCADERKSYANALITEVNKHGNDPETDGSFKASLHRTWMTFKAELTDNNQAAVVEECIRGENASVEIYDELVPGDGLTPALQEMIVKQYSDIKIVLVHLEEWKEILDKRTIVT